jgi:hypothetical protein
MSKFYVETNSFAAPFFSDQGSQYVQAKNATEALEKIAKTYKHPAGLYAAAAYSSADAKNKGEKPLGLWLCNHEIAKRGITKGMGAYSYLGHSIGDFEINGNRHKIDNPRDGRVVLEKGHE